MVARAMHHQRPSAPAWAVQRDDIEATAMSKSALLLLATTAALAPGCYARTGYYTETAYVAPAPICVQPLPAYVAPPTPARAQSYPQGYARVRVTRTPTVVTPRPVSSAPHPTYTQPPRELPRFGPGPRRVQPQPPPRVHTQPQPEVPAAPRTPTYAGKVQR